MDWNHSFIADSIKQMNDDELNKAIEYENEIGIIIKRLDFLV